jgi:hypothetical protein
MIDRAPSSAIRLFIGYDPREAIAYHVLSHSIIRHTSLPVQITPLALSHLSSMLWRERNPLQSTDFAFSRFLTPYLTGFDGWAIFMDCDMLVLSDIATLWSLRDERYAVQVVKHDYTPKSQKKFLQQTQTAYEKKNWSSVMLMNCAKCKALTPDYVNTASGLELHRFHWLGDDALIGEIPLSWNYLVDEYETIDPSQIHNLHYTNGGPYFDAYKDCSYAHLWFNERDQMNRVAKSKGQPHEASQAS